MQLLAFDTSTETLSIAVLRTDAGSARTWQYSGVGGAQASLGLIGAAMDLLHQAGLNLRALDAICFGSGPGSFTGLRTACAVAQGLGFGAGVPVLPVNSLLAVAEDARWCHLPDATALQVTALLDARMDEMYAATYAYTAGRWHALQSAALVKPEDLRLLAPDPGATQVLAGNVFSAYGLRLPAAVFASVAAPDGPLRLPATPTAAALLRLAPQLLAAGAAVSACDALPTYVRDKVAQTTAERAATLAERAAAVQTLGGSA